MRISQKLRPVKLFFCTFDKIKDGGKSIMTHYDVIGCVEVGMVQGIQLYLVF